MIVREKRLASLRADSGDRFEGQRFLYPNKRPITRLRELGMVDGRWYYAAADDTKAKLPATPERAIMTGGVFVGTKMEG